MASLTGLCKKVGLICRASSTLLPSYAERRIPTRSTNYATDVSSRVFELRVYSIHPCDLRAFIALSTEWMELRKSHSKLIGYWLSELGGINDAVHLWEYDSLNQRAKVRQALAKDEKWMKEFIQPMLPMLMRQENALVVLSPGTQLRTDVGAGGVYEMQILPDCQNVIPLSKGTLVGAFHSVIGPLNTVYRFIHHKNIDDAIANTTSYDRSLMGHSRLLIPQAWSPLQ